MAVPKRKSAHEDKQLAARPRPRKREDEEPGEDEPEVSAAPAVDDEQKDEDEDEDSGDASFDLRTSSRDAEVDQRQVESVTDRIFGSVLSKYGWQMDDRGHLEHVGEEDNGHRASAPPKPARQSTRK